MTDIKSNSNNQERLSIDGSLSSIGTESPSTKLTVNTGELPTGILSASDIAPSYFSCHSQNGQEIMRLDKEGMVFMGERITDAGQAYAAWMKAMSMMQGQYAQPKYLLTDDEILKVAVKAPPVHPWMIQGDVTIGDLRKMTTDFARAIERKLWEKAE